jgi:hypothetical protein
LIFLNTNSKKTRVHFKIFGQNRIQKFEVTQSAKFVEVQNVVKIMKNRKSIGFDKNRSVSVPFSTVLQCWLQLLATVDEESMVMCSVTPTSVALYAALPLPPSESDARSLCQCSSTSSRIRKKFAWLRLPSPSPAKLLRKAASRRSSTGLTLAQAPALGLAAPSSV